MRIVGMPDDNLRNRITIDPEILAGKPVVRDTRIPVYLILNLLGHGYTFDRIIEAYPALTTEDIQAAVKFNETRVKGEETRTLHAAT